MSYNSTEIWHVDFLNGILSQVKYYYQLGIFESADDVLYVLDDIKKLINHLKTSTANGSKHSFGKPDSRSDLNIYLNYTHTSSSVTFIEAGNFRMIYNQFLHPNFIRSSDENVCDYTERWFDKIVDQSTKISKAGELVRGTFFSTLLQNVHDLEIELGIIR